VITTDGLEYYIKATDSAVPPNVAYYGSNGSVLKEPVSDNDLDIEIFGNDTTAPIVIDHFPKGTGVSADTQITVTFSEPMDHNSVESAFSISNNVTGGITWDQNKLIFVPKSNLKLSTMYNVTIGTGSKDLFDNRLKSAYSWNFTTTAVSDTSYPSVEGMTPTGTDVPVDTTIQISFSERMEEKITQNAFSIEPSVNGVFEWLGSTTLTFIPSSPLENKTQYNVTISTAATSMKGVKLQTPWAGSFVTGEALGEEGTDAPFKDPTFWNTWEPVITGLTILVSIIIFIFGTITIRKKRTRLKEHMETIDKTYNSYKLDYRVCKKELMLVKELIKDDSENRIIEENHYMILDKKIDDYLHELKSKDKDKKRGKEEKRKDEKRKEGERKRGGEKEKPKSRDRPKEPSRESKADRKGEKRSERKKEIKKKSEPEWEDDDSDLDFDLTKDDDIDDDLDFLKDDDELDFDLT
jgi:hypothetical protein